MIIQSSSVNVPQMVNVELRILFTNAFPPKTETLRKFIQILQKVISSNVLQPLDWMSFNNEGHSTDTTLSKYVWEIKEKFKIMPPLKWSIIKSVQAYSNISKRCELRLQEKFEILHYPNPNELLNKRSELISKCSHVNKFLLSNYKSNDQTLWKCPIRYT